MVRIRFRRMGLKRQPTYRIVVTDQRNARNGAYIEVIGHHNPRTRPGTDIIDEARALYWLSVGAQPSKAVEALMKRTGTLDRFARLRSGEAMETLVAEAEAVLETNKAIDPRTNYPAPAAGKGRKAAAAAAMAEAPAAEAPAAEAVAAAAVAEDEPEADAPEAEEVEAPAAEEVPAEEEDSDDDTAE